MMADKMALRVAIDLLHVPSQVRLLRSEPLPRGVPVLLRIAAGDDAAEREAADVTVRSRDVVRRAAAFFIEQILFAPEADSYRVLGAASQASASELRGNAALLLKWLHPDRDPDGERSIFVSRVTEAWNNLKTPERRATYDELRRSTSERKSRNKAARRVAGTHHRCMARKKSVFSGARCRCCCNGRCDKFRRRVRGVPPCVMI
jgi:hypothetical protein